MNSSSHLPRWIKLQIESKRTANVEDQWRCFKQCFTLYLQAIGVNERDSVRKVALLLTIIVSDDIDVFNSFLADCRRVKGL